MYRRFGDAGRQADEEWADRLTLHKGLHALPFAHSSSFPFKFQLGLYLVVFVKFLTWNLYIFEVLNID